MKLRSMAGIGMGALAVLTLVAGCGGSDSPAATLPADVGLVVYAGPGIKFDKTEYTVAAGVVKVGFENRDAQRHTLEIVSADKAVIGKELEVGKSGDTDVSSYTLTPGTYNLLCLVPGHDAMRAKLVVTG